MVYIEKVDQPFSSFYLESFSYLIDEQCFHDALHFVYNHHQMFLKTIEIDPFKYHSYSFGTYLIKNEHQTWLGYIELYNQEFINNQKDKILELTLPILQKLKAEDEMVNTYLQRAYTQPLKAYQVMEIVHYLLQLDFYNDQKEVYLEKIRAELYNEPEELYIDFALYNSVAFYQEDIDYLLTEFLKLYQEDARSIKVPIIINQNNNEVIVSKLCNDQNSRILVKKKDKTGTNV